MNLRILSFLFLFSFFFSCSNKGSSDSVADKTGTNTPDKATLIGEINAIEAEFKKKSNKIIDKGKAKVLVDKTNLYVGSFPSDTLNPKLLFRGGEVARFIGDYDKAIALMEMLHDKYPNDIQSPPALFLQAFMYENNIKDKEKAKRYYTLFLTKYPDHGLASQVKTVLNVMDKTPEELVEEFKRKNKK